MVLTLSNQHAYILKHLQKKSIAIDGHRVDSKLKLLVDNALYEAGTKHHEQSPAQASDIPFYSNIPKKSNENKYYHDFVTQNYYIEVAGLHGNIEYEKKIKPKLKKATQVGCAVIVLIPEIQKKKIKFKLYKEANIEIRTLKNILLK